MLIGFALSASAVAGSSEQAAIGNLNALELSGIMTIGQEVQACLSDSKTRQAAWFVVGAERDGLQVETYDPAREAVLVRDGDRTRWITLRQAHIQSLPVARLEDGSVDWFHMKLSDKEKEQEAQSLMWDILEVGRLARQARAHRGTIRPKR